jgi:acyl phosphate:glycerol-3-phosphate acyltransferase
MGAVGGAVMVCFGYLLGAVPWGVVLGRIVHSTDLREHGSGSTGSTNAYRVLGWKVSVIVLVLDIVKGAAPVLLTRWLGGGDWLQAFVAVATVVGHCWSPFIHFRGGKGVATTAGAAAALTPWVLLVVPLMILVVAIWRYVSLASMIAVATAAAGVTVADLLGYGSTAWVFALWAMTAIIVVQHRSNIERLKSGTERRLTRHRRLTAENPATR